MYDEPEIAFLDDRLASHQARGILRLTWGPMAQRSRRWGVVRFVPRGGGRDLLVSAAVARGSVRRSFVTVVDGDEARAVTVLTGLAWWFLQPAVPVPGAGDVVPLGGLPGVSDRDLYAILAAPTLLGPGWREVVLPELGWDLLWVQVTDARGAWTARQLGADALQPEATGAGVVVKRAAPH